MTNANDARRIVLQSLTAGPAETAALRDSLYRVLAEDCRAPHEVPQFDNSGMDGFAVRTGDLRNAGQNRITLKIQADVPAGKFFHGSLSERHAIRIMTGAPIPAGADAVVEKELVTLVNGSIEVSGAIERGRNVRRSGEDIPAGSLVLKKGTRIGPAAIGVLASLGMKTVRVYRKVRVAVLPTGDEVVDFDRQPGPGQVRNSNALSLEAMLLQDHCDPSVLETAKDDRGDISRKIQKGLEYDALLTSGGISVGEHDYVLAAMESLGVATKFWKVNIKPGMPMAFGVRNAANRCVPVFALPGNPVSTLVTYRQFVRAGLMKMAGLANPEQPVRLKAALSQDLQKEDGKRHFVRGICTNDGGTMTVRPTGSQRSNILMSLVKANCLITIPEEVRNPRAGDSVEIELL